jgi:hypothetical protein
LLLPDLRLADRSEEKQCHSFKQKTESKELKPMRNKMITVFFLLVAIFCIASGNAGAQTRFGLRAGVTANPDQFHFGPHFVTDPLIGNLTFRPNLEIGVGSGVTTVAGNVEFAYGIPVAKTDASVYIGAGPALNVYHLRSDTHTGGGFNILVGVEHKNGLFGEIKVGAFDSPDFKFSVGFTFQ